MSDGAYWAIRRSNGSWVGELCGSKACRKRFLSKQQASRWTCTGDVIVRVTVRPKEKPAQLTAMVREFMAMVKQKMPARPCIPERDVVVLRLRLIVEEVFELIRACADDPHEFDSNEFYLMSKLEDLACHINLPEAIDALADIQVVTEGAFVAFGVNSGPVLDEVARSNASKLGGGLDANGKATKGANYSPPNIEWELRKQGWTP